MALDGITIGFSVRELAACLVGGRVDKVQQPEKDVVLLHVRAAGTSHRLLINANPTGTRLHLTTQAYESPMEAPVFCMLMRKHVVGGRVADVVQIGGDRLVRIDITGLDEMGEPRLVALWFEAMGRHSNLSLVMDGRIVDCLRHVTDEMSRVRRMLPGAAFEMPPRQDKLAPEDMDADTLHERLSALGGRADRALADAVAGVGAGIARELCMRLAGQPTPMLSSLQLPLFSREAAALFRGLPHMAQPHLLLDDDGLPRAALPWRFISLPLETQQPRDTLSRALDELYYERDRHERLQQRTGAFRRTLKAAEERTLRKLQLQDEEIQNAARMEEYRVAGELLTAFAHLVPKGAAQALLPNYYDDTQMEVALDPSLSPAANAQRYFKRYRKAHTARKLAAEQKERSLQELRLIEDAQFAMDTAQSAQDISDIKQPLQEAGLMKREAQARGQKKPKESRPLKYVVGEGVEILVGKNSLQNERLLKQADGEDVWLHAKDMPGSHVIVRTGGKAAEAESLMIAAKLAALYSKGKGSAVPVNYTLRKYVKKPSGAPAGFVTFSREKLLVASATPGELKAYQVEDK